MVYVMIDKDVHGKVTPENFCKLWPEDGGEIAKQVSAIIDDDGDSDDNDGDDWKSNAVQQHSP